MKKAKEGTAKKSEFEQLAMSGLRVMGIAAVICAIGLIVWHAFFAATAYGIPALVEGQQGNYGSVQTVNVILKDGTEIRCLVLGGGSNAQSISCDWANVTEVDKPS